MKGTNILWLALVALVLYIAMNSKSTAQQQQPAQPTTVRLTRIDARAGSSIQVSGRVIGFSCAPNVTLNAECFVATTD
jgi:hypothetical protein